MMGADKKMDRYLKSVHRRLNLPKDIKERVMSDLVSSISARREAGQSDEEILAELGSSKKAAADLNEQMKEYTYRKSPWRFAFLALAVLSGGWLAVSRLVAWICGLLIGAVVFPSEHASVGIVGGSDGPTAVFVTAKAGSIDWETVLILLLLVIGILGFFRLRKCKRET